MARGLVPIVLVALVVFGVLMPLAVVGPLAVLVVVLAGLAHLVIWVVAMAAGLDAGIF